VEILDEGTVIEEFVDVVNAYTWVENLELQLKNLIDVVNAYTCEESCLHIILHSVLWVKQMGTLVIHKA
jgi:hypothetical protein